MMREDDRERDKLEPDVQLQPVPGASAGKMTKSDLIAALAGPRGRERGEGCKLRLVCTSVHLSPAVARGVVRASAAGMGTDDDAFIDEAIAGTPKAAQAPVQAVSHGVRQQEFDAI
jgi:hypothetical protein